MYSVIEHLRSKMISVAIERGSLTHPDVIRVSEVLDRYLYQAQLERHVNNLMREDGIESTRRLSLSTHHRLDLEFHSISSRLSVVR